MDKELYLKTAFCCMACDGNIAEEEVQLIRDYTKESLVFQGLDVEKLLNDYILLGKNHNEIKEKYKNLYS